MAVEYYGSDINHEEAQRLMLRHIHKSWFDIERDLFNGKWFDYRFLNPVQATCLYAHHYVQAYRNAWRINVNSKTSEFIRVIKSKDKKIKEPRLFDATATFISGIWRGRQVADAMGMPYDLYLRSAFDWTLRYWKQSYLPQPHQLYTDLVTDRAAIDWEGIQTSRIVVSNLPQYQNEQYQDSVAQRDHHEWLFLLAGKRMNQAPILAQFVSSNILPMEKVRSRLGNEMVERIVSNF